jgi:hypothetical protein
VAAAAKMRVVFIVVIEARLSLEQLERKKSWPESLPRQAIVSWNAVNWRKPRTCSAAHARAALIYL